MPAPLRSIRARLGLLYGLLLGAALVVSDLILYVVLAGAVNQQVDQSLSAQAQAIAGTSELTAVIGAFSSQTTLVLPDLDAFSTPGTFVQVVDQSGKIAAQSQNLNGRELPHTSIWLRPALHGQAGFASASVDRVSLRLYQLPLQLRGQVIGVLQIARVRTDIDETLLRLRLVLVVVGLSGLLIALVAGWWLAGFALRPIDRFSRAAAAIGKARDFSQRLPPAPSNDEVGRLASTFNQMLESLEGAYAELGQALQAQRRFVADASHELRTPLTTIRTNLELLERVEDLSSTDREEALSDARAEVQRLTRLVGDLLTLARADAGLRLRLLPVDLAPLLNDIYRQARLLALPSQHKVMLDTSEPAWVLGDADTLRQLLLILIDNGIAHTPPGTEVRISLRSEADVVTMEIADRGKGIPIEHLSHVFERFYREDDVRTAGNSGLGLAIARWIAEQHGAELSVHTSPGRGTSFQVRLWRFDPTASLPAVDNHVVLARRTEATPIS